MIYLTFMNPTGIWNESNLEPILKYAEKHHLRVKLWKNKESGLTLVSVEFPYMGEMTGNELSEIMKGKFQSLGLASKEEFENGISIYPYSNSKLLKLLNWE